jgi:hypothetical protein
MESLDALTIEKLLAEQRAMVKRCLEDAQRCLAFNEALSKKLVEKDRQETGQVNEPSDKTGNLVAPLLKKTDTTHGASTAAASGGKIFSGMNQRDRVIQALKTPVYNVEDFYWECGFCQRVAKSPFFNYLVLAVIALNTIWMAIETDFNKSVVLSQAPWGFIVVDNLFTLFFMFEIACRFGAFRQK